MKLIFMGSPNFAAPALKALLAAGHEVAAVYAKPPSPAGRGHQSQPCEIHALAQRLGLPLRTPSNLKDANEQEAFAALRADAAVVAAYGLILPLAILKAPRLGCLNIHASLLPRWRGAAPIQRAILAGDRETGITIMQMDEGLDTGPILLAETVAISARTTALTLGDELSAMGARLIVKALPELALGRLKPTPQPVEGVTYAKKLKSDEGRLDWTRQADELERMVRALTPWPGAWFEHEGLRIKVLAAEVSADFGESKGEPGLALDQRPAVACGSGALVLNRLQRPGRAPMASSEFLRGWPLGVGVRLR